MRTNRTYLNPRTTALAAVVACWPWAVFGQATSTPATNASTTDEEQEELVVLSPFEVTASDDNRYVTSNTLAGNRLNTDVKDLGTSLSVYNRTFIDDIGATDNASLLQYTLSTEVGGIYGNYSGSGGGVAPNANAALNPQSNNRVRGLVSADNTRDLFLSSIQWDGYNIDAVDLQRGPNAILFGQGSPGGVINTRTKQATFRDSNELAVRIDEHGSVRATIDLNRVLLDDQLAVRFAAVANQGEFKQKQAFEDFNREWLAVRYEPGFLKRGRARTIIKADVEIGNSNSNRPRNMPPGDRITPWFFNLQRQLYNAAWMNDSRIELPGRGTASQNQANGQPNPFFQPYVNTNYGNNYFGGSQFFFMPGAETPALAMALNSVTYLGQGVDSSGNRVRDGNIGGLANPQPHGIRGFRDFALATNRPFASLAKDTYITDTNIFDFYHNLLDGDIKREWSDFKTYDVSLSQTFFDDKMGFDIAYHDETVTSGGYNPVGQTIFVDYYERWADGTNTPATGWMTDGTLNPGAGRPFVQLGNGRGETTTDRDNLRFTAFVSHNFNHDGSDHWLKRLLGTHTLTGMTSRDNYYAVTQNWVNSAFTGAYWMHRQFEAIKNANGRFWADFVPIRTVYIGDSLVNTNLGDDFRLIPPTVDPQLPDSVTLRYFDSTWNAPASVNPAAVWFNQVGAGTVGGPLASIEAENPANYVGWGNRQVQLLRATDNFNRDLLTNGRSWDDRYNKNYAFVWQGKFWNNAIVGTAGIRHDEVGQVLTRWDPQNTGTNSRATGDPTLVIPIIDRLGPLEEDSDSWGVVTHFNRLPFLSRWMEKLPVEISATYNKSNNFQTGQVFSDYFGRQLPLPAGDTEDIGVMVATKDGKYSLRVNKFESTVINNPSSGVQFWNYGNNVGIYAQAWSQIKYNYETRSNPASPRHGSNIISDLPVPPAGEATLKWNFDYQAVGGQTQAEAEALEIAVINAWDQWLAEMAPLPEIMANAWGFSWETNDLTESGLGSFRFTSELIAEGYEAELHAQITDGWRLTLNASRIESTLDNIGETLAPGGQMTQMEYLLDFDRRLNETVMGDLRIWGPGGDANARQNWNGYADGDLKARLAEQGTVVPENRLWHINVISNYDFKEGRFRGWNIGGAARYQSAATLAYTPIQGTNFISYDLSAPFRDKAQIDVDLWVGYNRKLFSDKINWGIKLNVANVGVGNSLLPVTVQPDGTHAARRIRPAQQIFMTNTFSF
jgi:hypothetical protein